MHVTALALQVGGKVLSKQGGVVRLSGPLPCDAVNLVQVGILMLVFCLPVLMSWMMLVLSVLPELALLLRQLCLDACMQCAV